MELQDNYPKFGSLGAEIIAISIDTEPDAVKMVERYGLEFPVLYDPSTDVTRSWGVFNLLGDGVAAPAAYVFDSSGKLVAYRIGESIADRPTAAELLSVLADA